MHTRIMLWCFCLLALTSYALAGDAVEGRVVGVSDGDTLTLLVDNEEIKVRLDGIDAPETGQAFGERAKQALSEAVFGKTVAVESAGEDRYGRKRD